MLYATERKMVAAALRAGDEIARKGQCFVVAAVRPGPECVSVVLHARHDVELANDDRVRILRRPLLSASSPVERNPWVERTWTP